MPVVGTKEERHKWTQEHDMNIVQARVAEIEAGIFLIDDAGFQISRNPSVVRNFRDPVEIKQAYYKEVADVVRKVTGAAHVFPFNHVLRTESPASFTEAYARFAHIDALLANDEAYVANFRRFLIKCGLAERDAWACDFCTVNTWQPIDRPAHRNPLAVLDCRSLDVACDVIEFSYAGSGFVERTGRRDVAVAGKDRAQARVLGACHSPRHRWVYWPSMGEDEILVFKQLDTRHDRAQCAFHTSFDDPTSLPDAPSRRSIETRAICVFERLASRI